MNEEKPKPTEQQKQEELKISVGHRHDKVVMSFGKSVQYLALDKKTAVAFATAILEHATQV